MKGKTMMMLTLVAMTAGLTVNAEEVQTQNSSAVPAQKAQVVTTSTAQKETTAMKLSVEEQAFVAKLNDQNRKTFSDKLSSDQRKSVMVAVKNGANADEAVQGMIAAKEIKEASAVVDAERINTTTPAEK